MRRPVISGVGVVSAFGVGQAALMDGLAAGRSAVGPIRSFDAATFSTRVAAEVPVVRADGAWLADNLRALSARLPARPALALGSAADAASAMIRRWEDDGVLRDRKVAFAVLAAAEAWAAAGCGPAEQSAPLCLAQGLEWAFLRDFLAIYQAGPGKRSGASGHGSGGTAVHAGEAGNASLDWPADRHAALPHIRYRSPVDLASQAVRELLGLAGASMVHTSACAAGALAVAHAASLIERGAADIVLCGATDSMVNPYGIGGMARIGAPSPRNEADACRPFDRCRDGLAMGEGAAVFVVEDEARARARGAHVLARIVGWGSTQDAYRATAPRADGSAAAAAMRQALAKAGLAPEDIGYINAHGTGTVLNDPAEARAIRAALGDAGARVPVSSIKGALGHLMAASGAMELAACLLPFACDLLPGTAHHRDKDPECDIIDVIGEAPLAARVEHVLSNSFGFGGQNATVILGRPQ